MLTLSLVEVNFSRNVLKVRNARGMTQENLAEKVGIGRSALTEIERGTRSVRLGEACAIAAALEVPLDMLLSKSLSIQFVTDNRIELEAAAPSTSGGTE